MTDDEIQEVPVEGEKAKETGAEKSHGLWPILKQPKTRVRRDGDRQGTDEEADYSGSTENDSEDENSDGKSSQKKYLEPEVKKLRSHPEKWTVKIPATKTSGALTVFGRSLPALQRKLKAELMFLAPKYEKRTVMEGNLKCPACWQSFADPDPYLKHIEICPVPCNVCQQLFPTNEAMKQHREFHHFDGQDFHPPECQRFTHHKGGKNEHINCGCVMCT